MLSVLVNTLLFVLLIKLADKSGLLIYLQEKKLQTINSSILLCGTALFLFLNKNIWIALL